jgi:hypothetical protein
MTNQIVQTHRRPPLQKAQGRGTHGSGTGSENRKKLGYLPILSSSTPKIRKKTVKTALSACFAGHSVL